MSVKHYNIPALKKCRQRIISVMKSTGLHLGKHFTLSPVNAASNVFEVQLATTKTAALKKHIEAVFKKQLGDSIEMHCNQGIIKIILGSLYTEFLKIGEKTGSLKSLSGKPEKKPADIGGFRETLVRTIESSTNVKANDKKIGFHCSHEMVEEEPTIVVHCAERFVTNEVLCFLENHDLYAKRILRVQNHAISISLEELKKRPGKVEMQVLFLYEELKATMRKVFATVPKVLTPRTLAVKDNQATIEIQFADQGDAVHFTSILHPDFSWSKEGKVVTLSIGIPAIKKVRDSVLLLDKRTKHGLLAVKGRNEIPRYVHMSHKYKEFHFLPFNRPVNKKHVQRLVNSIESFGPQSFVNIAETDCVDRVMRKWIVDGQHRFMAFQFKKMPILYTISKVSTKEEMVRLIAVLNHTSKTWHLRQVFGVLREAGIPHHDQRAAADRDVCHLSEEAGSAFCGNA